MLKKTLLAAAVATAVSAPAFADVNLEYSAGRDNGNAKAAETTVLATQTKAPVLAFSTSEETIKATFDTLGNLKTNGFVTLELPEGSDATFNESEVRQWLTASAANSSTIGLSVTARNILSQDAIDYANLPAGNTVESTGVFKSTTTGSDATLATTLEHSIDQDGRRLRIALAGSQQAVDVDNVEDVISCFDAVYNEKTTDPDKAAVKRQAINGDLSVFPAYADLPTDFADTNNGSVKSVKIAKAVNDYIDTDIDTTGTPTPTPEDIAAAREAAYNLLIAGSDAGDSEPKKLNTKDLIAALETASPDYTLELAQQTGTFVLGKGSQITFDFPSANNIFNLKSGSTGDVTVSVGAMRNAGYIADPEESDALFELKNLFSLSNSDAKGVEQSVEVEAKVADGFKQLGIGNDNFAPLNLRIINNTSNQELDLSKVSLKLEGDFSGFNVDSNGRLLNKNDQPTGLTIDDKGNAVTAEIADKVIRGGQNEALNSLLTFAIDKDNTTPIESQKMKLSATILGSTQYTFNDWTAPLADLFIIDRDGLTFDTILTGTQSSNSIHIRDINGNLPKEGGTIFVTVWEYDQHSGEVAGEGAAKGKKDPLAKRKPLKVKLPSKGAVTLNPAQIADQLGIEFDEARQARMVFEVETNSGEVAVKKKDSNGIDIQTGSQVEESGQVDFTL